MKSFINKRHLLKPDAANQSVTNDVRHKQSAFHANNRTEATVQRKFQQIANNRSLINQFKFENSSSLLQKQAPEEEELMQGKFNTLQTQELEEEELMQGKFETVQRVEEEEELMQGKFEAVQRFEEEELLQGKFATTQCMEEEEEMLQGKFDTLQKQENNTGLPDNLKSGMEQLSGQSLDHVKVHYNSSKPAAVQAHAYAQGGEIHLGSGQDKHLPHELGHVVQQMEGRVQPTTSVAGLSVNDNPGLETEATQMGERALQMKEKEGG